MHEYVQKSMTTTLPRNASRVRGAELSHPVAPASEGISPSMTAGPAARLADIIAPPDIVGSFSAGDASRFALIIMALPAIASPSAIVAPSSGSGWILANNHCSTELVRSAERFVS